MPDSLTAASDYSALPGEHVSIDQIVALNIRYWRRKAGMTQEELGERTGWSAPNISAAELSATTGKDRRRFDAHTLVTFAQALGIPLAALLMPPPDDGIARRFEYHAEPGTCSDMPVLASLLLSDPSDDDTPVMQDYRERYATMITRYLDPGRGHQLLSAAGDLSTAAAPGAATAAAAVGARRAGRDGRGP